MAEPMRAWTVTPDRAAEAVDVLSRVFPDFPGSDALDAGERRRISGLLHARTVETALAIGRLDAWGDPIVGVAVWLPRPAIHEPEPPRPSRPSLRDLLDADVLERLERFDDTMQRLRAIGRPERHVYLDMIGVVPEHRRRGIATALLDAGHAWADAQGLPCALDTTSEENVAFYARRGYEVVARERVPDSELELTVMRRLR